MFSALEILKSRNKLSAPGSKCLLRSDEKDGSQIMQMMNIFPLPGGPLLDISAEVLSIAFAVTISA